MDPRDQTFMTIHNLTPEANILFASDSIFDILGYQPDEVQGQSCFDYFHPQEVPFARSVHSRGVLLDKAAVLHYARILSRDGLWVSCECCFTVVHDVLVACTSIYLRGEKSERRALEAPQIRRIFSCSPRDPRYHMLEHLSPKFKMPPMEREPRAALILNRFTRNLSIMFATNAVSTILGLRPEEIKDKSFYECIQENCLQDAIQCLESAKANESIAYLRFWFRDPRMDENDEQERDEEEDEQPVARNVAGFGVDDVELDDQMDVDEDEARVEIKSEVDFMAEVSRTAPGSDLGSLPRSSKVPAMPYQSGAPPYQTPQAASGLPPRDSRRTRHRQPPGSFELEAVVSCTSDGLVVVLRKARPPIPPPHPPLVPAFSFEKGLFAAPWGQEPIRPYFPPDLLYTFRPPLLPQYMPLRESVKASGGPPLDQLMRSIRDVAVFAWALVGINGNMATYGRGLPRGGSQPAEGLPRGDPTAGSAGYAENPAHPRWSHPDDGRAGTCTRPHCRPDHPFSTVDTAPQNYNQTAPPPLERHTHGNPPSWPQSSASTLVGACEQAHNQHQHRPQNQFMQSSTHQHDQHLHHHHHHHHHYHEHQQPQQQQQLPRSAPDLDSALHGFPREPWAEASSSQAHGNPGRAIPWTRAPRLDYSNHGFQYKWQ